MSDRIFEGLTAVAAALAMVLDEMKAQQDRAQPPPQKAPAIPPPRVEVIISMEDVMQVLTRMEGAITSIRNDQDSHWKDFLAHDHPQPKPPQLRIGETPAVMTGTTTPTAESEQRAAPLPPLPHVHQDKEPA